MIEELLNLNLDDMISIDENTSKQFTGDEDFIIKNLQQYDYDDTQVVVLELGNYYLIASNLTGGEHCAICELYDESNEYIEDQQFLEEINLEGGECNERYTINEAVYSEDSLEIVGFAEYVSSNNFYNFLAAHKTIKNILIYRGVTIEPDNIIL